MKKIISIVCIALQAIVLKAQVTTVPFTVKHSSEFESPKGHKVMAPLGYGKNGIIQVNAKGIESFSLQKFSPELVLEKEATILTKERVGNRAEFERMVTTKNKTYLFARNVNKEQGREGVEALEFFPDQLDFAQKSVTLFESSRTVKLPLYTGLGTVSADDVNAPKRYTFIQSQGKEKFMYTYTLTPRERNDDVNKDMIGLYVFDEKLNKLWGGEYQMPYSEAMMDNLGYTLSSDGKIYLLVRVFGKEDRIAAIKKNGAVEYHYEVLVYQKDQPTAKAIEIKLDNYFPQEAYIYEDLNYNIVIAGFYSKSSSTSIDGAYMVKLEVDKGTVSRLNGGTYEIPPDVIKAYSSDWEKRRLEKRERKGENIGIRDLEIRSIATTPNGSIKIVAEQYLTYQYYDYTRYPGYGNPYYMSHPGGVFYSGRPNSRTSYNTKADDIFVFSIDAGGRLEWLKKIPKSQHSNDRTAEGLSLACSFTGNDVNIFFLDHIKNDKLPEDEPPYLLEEYDGGYLTGVRIDRQGNTSKYNLGNTRAYKTNFYIRYFVDGGNNNLIGTGRKKRKNMLFSIEAL